MLSFSRRTAVVIGVAAACAGAALAATARPPAPPPPPLATAAAEEEGEDATGDACLARLLCDLKRRVRPGKSGARAWTPEFCQTLAAGVREAAERHDLDPALLVAVMINESDLDEAAVRLGRTRGRLAKDSGLMGIRCVLDRGRCTNALVDGLPWRKVMEPVTNVELGARYLAHYRDGAGRSRVKLRVRGEDGQPRVVEKSVRCRHRDHAYWAHYNHGTRYIARGPARLYPHHVAVLYAAVARALGREEATAGSRRLAVLDVHGRPRGVGPRHREWTGLIRAAGGACPAPATSTSAFAASEEGTGDTRL